MIFGTLAVCAGLSLNLILQFALGSRLLLKKNELPVFQVINLFLSVIILWFLYTFIFRFFSWEFMSYFIFFPASVLVCFGIECLEKHFFPKKKRVRHFSYLTGYDGLIPASLILTANIALTFGDALVLSFFFALGCLFALVFLKEIRRKSLLEIIPGNLRGMPLAYISMGLLAMIFGAAAWILYRALGHI